MSDHLPPPPPPPDSPPLGYIMPGWLRRTLQAVVVICLPFVLVLGSVRLAMTEAFLRWEYQRPGFPADDYGFSTDDRLRYGPYGIRYLVDNRAIDYLADLEIDGQPAFNARELRHMEDVQAVTNSAIQALMLTGGLFFFALIFLIRKPDTRPLGWQGLRYGAGLALLLIGGLVVVVFANWDFFFDNFHAAFFAEGTWQFYRSDTLIRLYPEQFWFDAALFIGGLTMLGAGLCLAAPWLARRIGRAPDAAPDQNSL